MIKMKLKKKRLYNPSFPSMLEVNHYQLSNDPQHKFQQIKRRVYKRTFLPPLLKVNKHNMSAKEKEIKQIADYILKMKAKGLRYTINPEVL